MNFPRLLKQGNKVRIVAPSGRLSSVEILNTAILALKEWGLIVEVGDNVFNNYYGFSASDIDRFKDLQSGLNDPSVDFILCARGGYGMTRILDDLDLSYFEENPKWVVGFSDITAFLQRAYTIDIATIHGPMGTSFNREGADKSLKALRGLLFNGKSIIETNSNQLRTGLVKGELVGGNLAIICDSIGTTSELDTKDKILVLEDVGEYYYRIDRMLTQLARTDKLSSLKGLVLGDFSSITNGDSLFGEEVNDMVVRLTKEYDYPIALHMPIGHEPANFPFVFGAEYSLFVTETEAKLELISKL